MRARSAQDSSDDSGYIPSKSDGESEGGVAVTTSTSSTPNLQHDRHGFLPCARYSIFKAEKIKLI